MVYSYKGFNFPVPAQVAGEEIEKIERQYGAATKENILDSARSEDSPLHPIFEWRDDVAAEKYRLTQANILVCNIVVSHEERPDIVTRAFVNVGDVTQGRFVSVKTALSEPDTRDVVLNRAISELRMFQKKYSDLSELSKVFAAITELVA